MTIGNSDLPEATIQSTRERVNGQSTPMRWPSEHGRYFTIIKFVKYDRKNAKMRATEVSQADIVLPLPSNLKEYYAIQYGDVALDKLGGAMDTVDDFVSDYISKGGNMAEMDWGAVGNAGIGLAQAMARNTASFFSNDLGGIVDRVTGNIVNPHITSIFRGVGLREHTLQWKMHAKSAEESKAIRDIINFIRSAMHPTKKSDFLLNFPDEIYVRFFADGKPFLYPIFKCVVTSIVADQGSEGTNAFFKGTDEPVVINMELSLKEVESLTREDFGTNSISSVPGGVETPTNEAGTATGSGALG